MSLDRRLLGWGVFFILLGILPLAVQQGALSRNALDGAWRLWPLILVGIGVGFLLRRTPFDFAGGMIVAATFGLILGSLLAIGPGITVDCGDGTIGHYDTTTGTFSGPAQVEVQLGCGDLAVTTGPGSTWTLESGNSGGNAASIDRSSTSLGIKPGRDSNAWFGIPAGRNDWRLTLPVGVPVDIGLEVGAGNGRLTLGGATVRSVSVTVNAGEARVDARQLEATTSISTTVNAGTAFVSLPDLADSTLSATVNLGSLEICAPTDLGLEIHSTVALGGDNFQSQGLIHQGDVWTTPGLASAPRRATINVTTNLGGITLNPTGGCQ